MGFKPHTLYFWKKIFGQKTASGKLKFRGNDATDQTDAIIIWLFLSVKSRKPSYCSKYDYLKITEKWRLSKII